MVKIASTRQQSCIVGSNHIGTTVQWATFRSIIYDMFALGIFGRDHGQGEGQHCHEDLGVAFFARCQVEAIREPADSGKCACMIWFCVCVSRGIYPKVVVAAVVQSEFRWQRKGYAFPYLTDMMGCRFSVVEYTQHGTGKSQFARVLLAVACLMETHGEAKCGIGGKAPSWHGGGGLMKVCSS